MNFEGTEHLDLSPAEAWARLSDPRALGEALPAVEEVEVGGDGNFEATFRPTTGLGSTPMSVAFEVAERDEPSRLVVTGHGGAAEYAVRLRAAFELTEAGGGTDVRWTLELHLHGVLRSLTQRVIEQLAHQQVAAVLASAAAPANV
ncbi:MAG TPA: SRPBCC domain-containing protein [Solirubrobacterales bacterium]|nr:SRPBCC domain-containing protein [Solirubrobacterales bacterium]